MKFLEVCREFSRPLRCGMRWHSLGIFLLAAMAWPHGLKAQLADGSAGQAIRVTLTVNEDGSKTAYEFDPANHRATATTTSAEGKPMGKTRYVLDDNGRFTTGEIFGARGEFRFQSRYQYDAAGRLSEETQMTKAGATLHRIVYSYNEAGKQIGYVVYDGNGKVVGKTTPLATAPAMKKRSP